MCVSVLCVSVRECVCYVCVSVLCVSVRECVYVYVLCVSVCVYVCVYMCMCPLSLSLAQSYVVLLVIQSSLYLHAQILLFF